MLAMLFGGLEILFGLFLVPLGLLTLAFWIWMIVDAAQNKGLDQNEKILWIIVIALTHLLGAILYLFIGRPKRNLPPAHQT
jgi:hypothetical protein